MAAAGTDERMPRRKVALEHFLWEMWLPAIKTTIRKTTYLSYESHLRHHICPYVGQVRIDKIDGAKLNELYGILLERGRMDGTPLSPATVRRVHTTLHRAFRDAARWGLITRNPATSSDPPKLRANGRFEFSTWSAAELRHFLRFVRDDDLYPGCYWPPLGCDEVRC